MIALADFLPESADGGLVPMLDRQTILVLLGLLALALLALGFAVRPFGRGSRYRRAPYGRLPGQVPIVGHRTAMEINIEQEKLAALRASRAARAGADDDAAAGAPLSEDEPRREQA